MRIGAANSIAKTHTIKSPRNAVLWVHKLLARIGWTITKNLVNENKVQTIFLKILCLLIIEFAIT
jgi:hypothetical protein